MKYRDIRLLAPQACRDKLKEEMDYLVKLRFAHALTPIENSMKIREAKKRIARLQTAYRMHQLKQLSE